jgi:5-methylcytosine-specific restriction endonuclease McrA
VQHTRVAAKEREARRAPRVIDGELQSGGGRSPDWRALRAEVLARDPICKDCGVKPSKHADHVLPKREGGRDVASNLRGLCHSCHSRKTAAVDGGFGNPKRATGRGVANPSADVLSSARPPFFTRPQVSPTRLDGADARPGGR